MTDVTVTPSKFFVVVKSGDPKTVTVIKPQRPTVVKVSSPGPRGPQGNPGPPKSITLPFPISGDSFTLYRTDAELSFEEIIATVQGTSNPAVSLSLSYGADRSAANTPLVANTSVTNTTNGQSLPLSNQPILADNYIRYFISSISGTVTELNLSFRLAN